MWKKLLSLLKGKTVDCKKEVVLVNKLKPTDLRNTLRKSTEREVRVEQKVDLEPMFSKLFEDEYAFLSFAQGELRKGRLLVSQSKFSEARDVLKPLVVIVKHSLIANYESERREKLLDIVEGSTIVAHTYIKEGNYSNAYEILEDVQQYAEDLTLLASNLKGTLTLIIQMYCMYLKCCHKLGEDGGKIAIREKTESIIAILSSCISKSSISDKIQIIERICDYIDELVAIKAYKDACSIYSLVLSTLKWEELNDYSLKHSYAILYGRYVGSLLNSSQDDTKSCIVSCLTEVDMYKNLLEEKNDAQAKMDLAIAYSHLAECYSLMQEWKNYVTSHVSKIILLTDAIKGNISHEDDVYDNNRLSESIIISLKNCINEFGEVTSKNVNYYREIFNVIKNLNQYYLENSELLAYINLIAGELFKYYNEKDLTIAQECLITRFTSLLYLLNNYGAEKDIAKDFAETITYAQPFIIKNEKTINDDLKVLWINSFSKAKEIFNL